MLGESPALPIGGNGQQQAEEKVLSPPPPSGTYVPPLEDYSTPRSLEEPSKGDPLNTDRRRIAQIAIAILGFIVLAAFVTLWLNQDVDRLVRVLEILFTPIVTLVAAVVAFYYRSQGL